LPEANSRFLGTEWPPLTSNEVSFTWKGVTMKIKSLVTILFSLASMLMFVGCSSEAPVVTPEMVPTRILTLNDIEGTGFTKANATTDGWAIEGLSESWDGEILVDGGAEFLEVLIFDKAADATVQDKFNRYSFRKYLTFAPATAFTDNIAIACQEQTACNYLIEQLR